MKTLIAIAIFVASLLLSILGFSQIELTGQVTVFDSIAVVNAEITVKSSKEVYKTDEAGNFALKCQSSDKLKVQAKGFKTQTVKVEGEVEKQMVSLQFKSNTKSREIAIEAGHVTDVEKLRAVSFLRGPQFDYSAYENIYDIIQDRFSGVYVNNDDLIIRGLSSISPENSAALIVVDGLKQNDSSVLRTINTNDIKDIKILKGADAVVYGSQGGNGVVIIKTKRGADWYQK